MAAPVPPQQMVAPVPPFAGFTDYNPSDLAQTMQQVNLNSHDPAWYMDSGASTHLTPDPGKITTPMSNSPVQSFSSEMGLVFQFMGQAIPFTTPSLALIP